MDFEWVHRQLSAAVARVCPGWLRSEREDLVQTAMIRLLERLDRDEGKTTLNATYVWKTAYSVTLDEIRRARRRYEVAGGEDDVGDGEPAPGPDPERSAERAQTGRALQDCLGRIARPRRHVVLLSLLGYTPAESGALLGWSAKRVSNLLHRGQGDLRRCLEAKGVEP